MKKPVPSVYKSTLNCSNKMEMINSLHLYIKRSEKAFNSDNKDILLNCCNKINLILEKLSKQNLNIFQVILVNKYIVKTKKYSKYCQGNNVPIQLLL